MSEAATREGLELALSMAPTGARCMSDGFTEWRMTPYGWQNTLTGETVANNIFAGRIWPTLPEANEASDE